MPRHAGITLGVASLVGTTVGCLVLWKLINRRRQQLCTNVDHKDLCTALAAEIHGSDQKVHQSLERERSVFSVEKLLQAPIKIVSKAEEWEAVWPSLQRDLDEYPVLGVDCEWVFYAARDAQVSVALFLQLLGFFSSDDSTPWDFILSKCQGLIDVPFKGKGVNGDINIIPRQKKEGLLEQSSTNSQGDPRKNKKKPLGVGYSVRYFSLTITEEFDG
ncbi:exonuclease 3'-5' domain-containing protein 2-like isoform X1 [Ranitomeya variabilis]|uniref:exonuclease 3'-5' domain-containing protein 2-like isoform X1 n=1 Tax=Ranitomeya variabilis TaxID=490064 RepID=UPI0040574C60